MCNQEYNTCDLLAFKVPSYFFPPSEQPIWLLFISRENQIFGGGRTLLETLKYQDVTFLKESV